MQDTGLQVFGLVSGTARKPSQTSSASGSCRCKLDRHDFKGIFLGYTATDQNIIYLDLDSGVVKSSHHAQFDEAWYLQPTRPLAAQLLYDLGVLPEPDPLEDDSSSLEAVVTQE